MIWTAILNSGKIIKEYDNGKETNFKELDKLNVEKFILSETGKDHVVKFSGDTGIFKFGNMDLRKLKDIDNLDIKLSYDTTSESFKIGNEDLLKLNNLFLLEQGTFNTMEFDQSGKFLINGVELYLGFELGGEEIKFINQPPYNDIIHYKDAITDFIGKKNSSTPYKKLDAVLNYSMGYNKVHTHDSYKFNLSCEILFSTIQRTVTLSCRLSINETLTGNVLIHYGDKLVKLNATIMANQPARIHRILSLV